MKVTSRFSKISWLCLPTLWLLDMLGSSFSASCLGVHPLLGFPVLNLTRAQRGGVHRSGMARTEQLFQPLLLVAHSWVADSVEVTAPALCLLSLLTQAWDRAPYTVNGQKNSDFIMLWFLNYEHTEGRASPQWPLSSSEWEYHTGQVCGTGNLPWQARRSLHPCSAPRVGWWDPGSHFSSFLGCSIRRY